MFPFILRNVLNGLVQDGVLFLTDLSNIENFTWGYNDRKNKPEEVTFAFIQKKKANLKGTATQKWCLFRLLPLIFASDAPQGNVHREVYLLYRKIIDIV